MMTLNSNSLSGTCSVMSTWQSAFCVLLHSMGLGGIFLPTFPSTTWKRSPSHHVQLACWISLGDLPKNSALSNIPTRPKHQEKQHDTQYLLDVAPEALAPPLLVVAAVGLLPLTQAVTTLFQVHPAATPKLHHRDWTRSSVTTTMHTTTTGGQALRPPLQRPTLAADLLSHTGLRLTGLRNLTGLRPIGLHHGLNNKKNEAQRFRTPPQLTPQTYVSVTAAAALAALRGTGETGLNLVVRPSVAPQKQEAPADTVTLGPGPRQRPIAGPMPQSGPQQHGAHTPVAVMAVMPQLLPATLYSSFSSRCSELSPSSL